MLEVDAEGLGRPMTVEMGRPVRSAMDEILTSAKGCRCYAEHAGDFLADGNITAAAKQSYVRYEPRARYWQSCRGTIRSGKYFVLRPRP